MMKTRWTKGSQFLETVALNSFILYKFDRAYEVESFPYPVSWTRSVRATWPCVLLNIIYDFSCSYPSLQTTVSRKSYYLFFVHFEAM